MLADRYSLKDLIALLPDHGDWHPYPAIDERDAWLALDSDLCSEYVSYAEVNLGYEWPSLPANVFLDYKRNGNRSRYQNRRYARRHMLRDLVIAECIENKGRFLDDIANGIWTTCEETYWGVPAHIHVQEAGVDLPDIEEPTVDLFAGETVSLLAWTAYLLGNKLDTVSPLVRKRIAYESQRRILDPCRKVNFPWMGLALSSQIVNNWDPWINSNWLVSILLQEKDPDRRAESVHKSLRSLDVFLNIYAESGGCDEGPGYWGRAAASLFDCLETLYSATEGKISFYDEPKIRNMGMFIYKTQIADNYYVNFADASAINAPVGSLVYLYGKRINDMPMMQFGAWRMAQERVNVVKQGSNLSRILPKLFEVPNPMDVVPSQPMPREAWYDGIQVMVARDAGGTSDGLFVAAKGGHNNESHNHNDIGNFVVYVDGLPVLVDAGVETYTRKTFSDKRYDIWTMQSSYHTLLPEIDGVQQAPGRAFKASNVAFTGVSAHTNLSLDIATAYPSDAKLESWQRSINLRRGECVDVVDSYVFQVAPKQISFCVLTPCEVSIDAGMITFSSATFGKDLASGAGALTFDSVHLQTRIEVVPITDSRMSSVWGDHLNRVVFMFDAPAVEGTLAWSFTPKVE